MGIPLKKLIIWCNLRNTDYHNKDGGDSHLCNQLKVEKHGSIQSRDGKCPLVEYRKYNVFYLIEK